ncbi:amidophosphoribosyltransferase [Saprolegnia diclina VS20]|uniref:Amidophosphoribosyltransferase n=1 Tax=Saprolegnia diclina (strain VS20) TaxID=1156394 RepID=T0RRW3_SAPDV|nr:amidophosphoribosyltransferase [Saprolegnia diclina VS20]EQC32892.1 amidophosphoribosyltransferase [Saprolegnia diclina VS20]|eukprot:XP_008613578.1 amidophosphoribosyltransferase [Saprolegnia diclina VS20]
MCGIIAVLLANKHEHCNQSLYDGLTVLQHRGQDAAGIMTSHNGKLHLRKDNGLVRDVFKQNHMVSLMGCMGIGHCRYPTAGSSSSSEAQPFYTNSPYGIALAHNGNLTNSHELVDQLANTNFRHVNTDSDSEMLLNILADELLKSTHPLTSSQIFDAVSRLYTRCRGGYAVVALINGYGILAFRDPNGIRPLVYGSRKSHHGTDYAVASESVAIDTLDYKLQRDVAPGEAIFIGNGGQFESRVCCPNAKLSPCIFEHVYFARPDSVIDGISVYQARRNMGSKLAEKVLREYPDHGIDVVIPIPDTSRTSALEMSHRLNIPYREGFVKNRYIARTFIMPGQVARKKTVRMKLNAIKSEFEGKVVLLVDDSIVRGTTGRQIVQIARESGAKKVYFASAAPCIRHPNVYGIDMPTRDELIAHNRTEVEIARELTADHVIFQDIADLKASCELENPQIKLWDASCFDGLYVSGDINEAYFKRLHDERCDARMQMKNLTMGTAPIYRTVSDPMCDEVIDMYNNTQ